MYTVLITQYMHILKLKAEFYLKVLFVERVNKWSVQELSKMKTGTIYNLFP